MWNLSMWSKELVCEEKSVFCLNSHQWTDWTFLYRKMVVKSLEYLFYLMRCLRPKSLSRFGREKRTFIFRTQCERHFIWLFVGKAGFRPLRLLRSYKIQFSSVWFLFDRSLLRSWSSTLQALLCEYWFIEKFLIWRVLPPLLMFDTTLLVLSWFETV